MTTTLDTDITATSRGAVLTAAITGPLLLVLSFLQPQDGPPLATATAAQIRAYAAGQETAIRVGALAGVAAVVGLLVLTAALAQLVRDALPHSLLAGLGAGAGYLLAFCLLLSTIAGAVPTVLPDLVGADLASTDDSILRGWWAVAGVIHLLGDFQVALIGVVVGAFSLAARRARLLPRWLSWAGFAVTAAAALGLAAVTAGLDPLYAFWFAAMFGWALWMPVTGVTLALRRRAATRPE